MLGCGSSVFEDLSVYLKSLYKLQRVMAHGVDGSSRQPFESIYPGRWWCDAVYYHVSIAHISRSTLYPFVSSAIYLPYTVISTSLL